LSSLEYFSSTCCDFEKNSIWQLGLKSIFNIIQSNSANNCEPKGQCNELRLLVCNEVFFLEAHLEFRLSTATTSDYFNNYLTLKCAWCPTHVKIMFSFDLFNQANFHITLLWPGTILCVCVCFFAHGQYAIIMQHTRNRT
jgi:hypothetical protein